MKTYFFAVLGVLEVAIACAVVVIGLQLPSRRDVAANFERVEKVTGGSEHQVRLMREQVADLRKQEFGHKSEQLRKHTLIAADTASFQQIDFDTVTAIARSLADVSKGLNAWADTVDAERMKKVSASLGDTADYLELGVAAPSEKSAAELDKTLGGLEKDSANLAALLRQTAPDLKAARAMHDGLGSFDMGLEKLGELVKPDKIVAMKDGLAGMETSLSTTAEQVDKVSAISYPVVTFNGLKPVVENKPFWPDGEKVAEGLRKATKGVQAANKQLDVMAKNLPELEKAIAESRKSVGTTREALGSVLKKQAETEKLMKTVPEQTAALAEALPKIGRTFTGILKETKRLRELSTGLKAVQKSLNETLRTWPEVAKGLKNSAVVLERAKAQLDEAAARRADYEAAMASSTRVARSLAELLPAFTDHLDSRLGQQEASLEQMGQGLAEVNRSLPVAEEKTANLIGMVKWLLYLVGMLVAMHAAWVLADVYSSRRTGRLGAVRA